MTGGLLLDNSAWSRLRLPAVPETRVEELGVAIDEGRIVVCSLFLLEAGYSARDRSEHTALFEEMLALPFAGVDRETESAAFDAQRQLVRTGHHRLPPVDLLIAALADRHELGVLHYDADYDAILEHTDLRFDSVWLAERGTL